MIILLEKVMVCSKKRWPMDEHIKGYDLLWKLPIEERSIAYLYFAEGKNKYDISKLLNVSPQYVNRILDRSRIKMNGYLKREFRKRIR